MTDAIRVVRVKVTGRVQGVGYRAWTADIAAKLGLNGWVRNLRGGAVEALFAGSPDKVAAMLERCHEGPWAARVTTVEIEEEGGGVPQGFEIRRTA
jgi:acylphosphatase